MPTTRADALAVVGRREVVHGCEIAKLTLRLAPAEGRLFPDGRGLLLRPHLHALEAQRDSLRIFPGHRNAVA